MPRMIQIFLLLSLFALGCGGAPHWVKGVADFDDAGVTALYGVGMTKQGQNPAATRAKAESRARTELAKQIETYSTSFIKDFMNEHQDYMADPGAASSTEYFASVAKNIAEATLAGSMIIDSYDDGDNWYSLAKLPLESKFMEAFRARVAESIRDRKLAVAEDKANQMLEELDKELVKKTDRQSLGQ